MNKLSLKYLCLTVIAISAVVISQAQITSYPDGGVWDSDTTWIGGSVPGAGNQVLINGNVFVTPDAECSSITISSGGTLQNESSSNPFMIISGNITNYGVIKNNFSHGLYLHIGGNIENHGIWENTSTYLVGTNQQNIYMLAGKHFGSIFDIINTTASIVATSDLHFINTLNLNDNTLNLANHDIRFSGPNTYFGNGTILHPGEFLGTVNIYNNTLIEGDLIITDTLQNSNSSNGFITLVGNLTNNGIIRNNYSNNLYLYLNSDIINNGIWENNTTYINGTDQQLITLQAGKSFNSRFEISNSSDSIVATTDLYFKKALNLNNNILNLVNHNIRFTGTDTYFGNGTILNPYEFQGTVSIYSATLIEGDLIITDTLQNRYSSNGFITLVGNLTNNGIIRNNNSNNLYLYLNSDIINNGIWENNTTYLNGTNQQTITLQTGKGFNSRFENTNSSDTIVATTDLYFAKFFDLNNNILNLNNHNIRFTGPDTYFGHGTILNPNEFQGTLSINSTTYVEGDLIITDTLQNKYSTNPTMYVVGNVTNNGIIKNNITHSLNLHISGNFVCNGPVKGTSSYSCNLHIGGDLNAYKSWVDTHTTLDGTVAQNIYLEPGYTFGSDFIITNSSDTIHALTDIVINGYFNINNNILNLNNHNVEFIGTDNYFGMGTIVSPSEFRGTVNMNNITYIEGDLIITDTLQNKNGTNSTLYLTGNLTNNGIIKNNAAQALFFHIGGNLNSYGTVEGSQYYKCNLYIGGDLNTYESWYNASTAMEGTSAQSIYLEPGKIFGSDFIITNSSDTIHALTDIVINGYFNINNNILNLNDHNVQFIGTQHYFGRGTIISPSEFRGTVNMNYTTNIEGDLIITDTLQNKNGTNSTIFLTGDLTNNGVIKNNDALALFFHIGGNLNCYGKVEGTSNYRCNLYIGGDLNAYESWYNAYTTLEGASAQSIYLEPGKVFGSDFIITNSSDTIHTLTDFVLDGYLDLNNNILNLNDKVLQFIGIEHYFGRGTIISPSEFKGTVNMHYSTNIEGDLVITDTLQNKNGTNPTIYLTGNLTNNGVIKSNTSQSLFLHIGGIFDCYGTVKGNSSYKCNVYIGGDLNAYQNWYKASTTMEGTSAQSIYLEPGSIFGSDFRITNSSDTIHALTDLVVDGYLDLNNNILNLNDQVLQFIGTEHYFGRGTILSPSEFKGTVNMHYSTNIEGDLVITDTLQNKYGASGTLNMNGSLTNNGIIKNNSSGNLYLNNSENIYNYGIWENTTTTLNGATTQDIFLQSGHTYASNFLVSNSSDTIHAVSDLVFDCDFNINENILNLDNHKVQFIGDDHIFGRGTIVSPSEFLGTINMHYITNIEGDLVIADVLQNKYNTYGTINLNGCLTNNGIIRNNSSQNLYLYINEDITNGGIWQNTTTFLNGTIDQNIALIDDKPILSEVRFEANFGTSPYQWYYNGTILDLPGFTGETSADLIWDAPVSDTSYGTYYCQTSSGDSRNIRVNAGIFSLYFDGVDNYIDCGHDASLNLNTTITIEAWIKPAGWGELEDYGLGRIIDKTRYKILLNDSSDFFNEKSMAFIIHSGETSYSLNTPTNSINLHIWQHIAATYDGNGVVNIYIDGVEQIITGTPPPGKIDDNSSYDLFIGETYYQNRAFEGNIDELRIWNTILDNSSIKENMYRPLQGNEVGLVSYWQFNEISGTIAYDYVGGNNGTLYNMTDANKNISTTPVPFYTIGDGNWDTNSTWAPGQNYPTHPWSRAKIKNSVILNSNMELIEMTIDTNAVMTISTGDTLIITGN